MNQANLFKKLRIERGYTQQKLSEGVSSRTTLSSFENRGTELSSHTLFLYLDKMNIRLEEFQIMLNDGEFTKKRQLAYRFSKQYYKDVIDNNLIAEIEEIYQETQDIYYYVLWFEALTMLDFKKDNFSPNKYKKEISIICDYLFKIEKWQHFELTTFMNLMFAFSDEMIIALFNSSKDIILANSSNPYYQSLMTNFFLNGTVLGFERQNKDIINLFFNGLKKIAEFPQCIYGRIMVLYFENLLETIEGHIDVNFDDFYSLLKILKMEKKIIELKEFQLKILHKY
ncbi:TPA: helix-turn-helix domain-containing protein [Enterococcus faecium]|nr:MULTISPECIES: Rgg/GadR/MutR family transcriptional regulator [Enterococcus]EGP4988200.1 helix-turn-helix domain-containing protein [Enterococcus faecium]EMF0334624.1 helix-turn-helix domain-containing protein [Enterococcus faecium]MDU0318409.1 helix-turn-helix domain-containing protein [Enterococcus sp. 2STP]ROX45694.1 Rgg/GadR/MutR family transcriptional regulator [Enterococcus faecium]ROX60596.1 Rgg/GadR/MutR family transcriptional regulator [Enterococcus faecium]